MNDPPANLSFEDSLAELDRIVRDLVAGAIHLPEAGAIGAGVALARSDQGVSLSNECGAHHLQAEARFLLLTGADENQQPILRPFKHEATAKKPAPRRRPRSANGPAEEEMPF